MLDRIENLRRLKEQCERRARVLRSKGEYHSAGQMERQALSVEWQIQGVQAEAALASFAAQVED